MMFSNINFNSARVQGVLMILSALVLKWYEQSTGITLPSIQNPLESGAIVESTSILFSTGMAYAVYGAADAKIKRNKNLSIGNNPNT